MKKCLIIVAPGYRAKSGYYLRVKRDAEHIKLQGYAITIVNFVQIIKNMGVLAGLMRLTNLLKRTDLIVSENISAIVPVLMTRYFLTRRSIFVNHGSLEDLRPYKFYAIRKPIYYLLQRYALRKYSAVIAISEIMANELRNFVGEDTRLFVVPNVPDQKFLDNTQKAKMDKVSNLTNVQWKPPGKTVITYCGNLQAWQKVDFLIEICKLLSQKSDKFFFLFLTQEVEALNLLLSSNSIPKSSYSVKTVRNHEVPYYIVNSDYLYAIRDVSEINRVSCPTKLVEYLYSGSFILLSETIGDISSVVSKNHLGIVFNERECASAEYVVSKLISFSESADKKVTADYDLEKSIFSYHHAQRVFLEIESLSI
jgi:hypothetical protein